jgi:hypothetical protein
MITQYFSHPILAAQMPDAIEQAKKAIQEADRLAATVVGSSGAAPLWTSEVVERLTWGVLIFATVVIVLMTLLLYRKDANGHQTLKCFGLVLIITLSSILLIVGYSSEQLTPIIGLFGAIAGYLLGKETGTQSTPTPDAGQRTHVPATAVTIPVETVSVPAVAAPPRAG